MTLSRPFLDLLQRARQAPEDVTVIQDEEGHTVTLVRAVENPSAYRMTFTGFGDEIPVENQWVLPASANPTSIHPEEVPFLQGIPSTVVQSPEGWLATWGGMQSIDSSSGLTTDLPDFISPMAAEIRSADDKKAAARDAAAELRRRSQDSDMQSWLGDMAKSTSVDPRFEQAYATVCGQLEGSGWTPVDASPDSPDSKLILVSEFTKQDRVRKVTSCAFLGISQLLMVDSARVAQDQL